LAFVLLSIEHARNYAGMTFDYPNLLASPVSSELQTVLFFLFLLGFAAKTPLFPLHTWLPTLAMEGTASVAALMSGLKLGAFGMIRYLLPLTPDAAQRYHWVLAGFGLFGLMYGAMMAFTKTNLRSMLAYASMSHVGLVVLGISTLTISGLQGGLFQLLNFTFVAGGLFLLTGFLRHRSGSTDLLSLGGVARSMPLLSAFFLFFGFASLGLPGTSGFPAEFLLLMSILKVHMGAGLAVLVSMIFSAAYFLTIYRKSFLGPLYFNQLREAMDLCPRELIVVVCFGFFVLLFGLVPSLILDIVQISATEWVQHFVGK
ncbi:MAG: NADH-quinone oxidoreductase subunit M, partial [Magnetococcus sp. DMHC-6]